MMHELDLFHGPNAGYLLELYDQYCQDPNSVDEATRSIFAAWEAANAKAPQPYAETPPAVPNNVPQPTQQTQPMQTESGQPVLTDQQQGDTGPQSESAILPTSAEQKPAAPRRIESTTPRPAVAANADSAKPPLTSDSNGRVSLPDTPLIEMPPPDVLRIVGTARLVRMIRELGHLGAQIDPLGKPPPGDPGLELETHGLTTDDLASLPPNVVFSPLAEGTRNALEAVQRLRQIYSNTLGYEDDHVQHHEERAWLREAAESKRFFADFDAMTQRHMLYRLTEVESFERFLHQTFPGQKRFSLEGNDMLIPMLDSIIRDASESGTQEVVIGMAHRGRLNVLAHILGKPYSAILAGFQGPSHYNKGTYLGWTGDVKYHLGARTAYRDSVVYEMPITLAPNPSHLEFVNPVVEGRARAVQEQRNQPGSPVKDRKASLPILIHGDASFPGQGVVAETLNLSRLPGYHTGGTIHIITNNQIGFTTDMNDSRSTLYASDLAKGFEIPIVHVNADDPHACLAAARMAFAYRERFEKDFLIDLVGYRRWGHNEGDEPSFTQPRMYNLINQHPTVRQQWAEQLQKGGIISTDEAQTMEQDAHNRLHRALKEVEKRGRIEATVAVSVASLLHRPVEAPQVVSAHKLIDLNEALLRLPEGFHVNRKLERLLERRRTSIHQDGGIDWGHAETLAFATILTDDIPIRLTGQDSERGTFSQRHLVLSDVHTGRRYIPLQELTQARASFAVYNSPLSESATLGFEYGYSTHAPDVLVLWEGQFGDFCNGAQVFIDQFIVSGYAKWGQRPALVLLLPHGHEGQGPEHSSARIERFLQLAADNNIRVVNCTTAAQYYHVLRRQAAMLQSDPRPLILLTPKSLLRHPLSASSLADLTDGQFQPVLPPQSSSDSPDEITRLILCSGKVFIDLTSNPQTHEPVALPSPIAAARVEELYPFPASEIESLIATYHNLREMVWLQEEPRNMGAWRYIEPHLRNVLENMRQNNRIAGDSLPILYCGRSESASPAEGSLGQHEQEQARLIHEALHGVSSHHLLSSTPA
ncbi:MAG: 2-oxoglutarate dehydrogenase E1 component [Chloroflexaceae bacterium]|nr:2-oxoglutarate dehydrogenase E1 component [Chloroflexaceae bacterium]